MLRKLISELVGTMLLVVFGCGTAVATNTFISAIFGNALPFSMLVVSLAFGLILMALVYTIGPVSGAHVNPAVSIAMAIDKRMSILECVEYVVVQILGGFAGALIIGLLFGSFDKLGANGFDKISAMPSIVTLPVAIIIEIILTFVFVLVVMSVTKKENSNNGIIIGLALTLVHILGMPFTGTSVNPARSIGVAVLTSNDKGIAVGQLWVFIVAPIVGAILAALFYKFIINPKNKKIKE